MITLQIVTKKGLLFLLPLLLSACAIQNPPIAGDQAEILLKNLTVKDNVLMELKVTDMQTSRLSASILRNMELKGHCSLPQPKSGNHVHSEMAQSTQIESIEKIISENCSFTTELFDVDGKYQAKNLSFDCTTAK